MNILPYVRSYVKKYVHVNVALCKLKNCTNSLFTWFKENHMKPNGDKCYLLALTEKSVSINIEGSNVKKRKEQKLLDVKFNSSLSFECDITSVSKKASHKLHALARIVYD